MKIPDLDMRLTLEGSLQFQKALERFKRSLEEAISKALLTGSLKMPDLTDFTSNDTLYGLSTQDIRQNLLTDIAATYGDIPLDIIVNDDENSYVVYVRVLNDEHREVLCVTISVRTITSAKDKYLAIHRIVIPAIAQLMEQDDDEDE